MDPASTMNGAFMRRTRASRTLAVAVLLAIVALGLAACGGDDEGPLDLRATISGVSDANITGTALMTTLPTVETSGPTGRLRQGCGRDAGILSGFCTADLEVSGLPEGTHASSLRKGPCASPGDVARELEDLVADASGDATSRTQWGYFSVKGVYQSDHVITIHATDADSAVIACGELAMRPDPARVVSE